MKQPKHYLRSFDDLDSLNCGLFIVGLCLALIGFLGQPDFSFLATIKPFIGILGLAILTFAFLKLSITARRLIDEMTADHASQTSHDSTSARDRQSL